MSYIFAPLELSFISNSKRFDFTVNIICDETKTAGAAARPCKILFLSLSSPELSMGEYLSKKSLSLLDWDFVIPCFYGKQH